MLGKLKCVNKDKYAQMQKKTCGSKKERGSLNMKLGEPSTI